MLALACFLGFTFLLAYLAGNDNAFVATAALVVLLVWCVANLIVQGGVLLHWLAQAEPAWAHEMAAMKQTDPFHYRILSFGFRMATVLIPTGFLFFLVNVRRKARLG